jgi:hypothetical protein
VLNCHGVRFRPKMRIARSSCVLRQMCFFLGRHFARRRCRFEMRHLATGERFSPATRAAIRIDNGASRHWNPHRRTDRRSGVFTSLALASRDDIGFQDNQNGRRANSENRVCTFRRRRDLILRSDTTWCFWGKNQLNATRLKSDTTPVNIGPAKGRQGEQKCVCRFRVRCLQPLSHPSRRYKPSGGYFVRAGVGGKLIRKSLEPTVYSVAVLKMEEDLKEHRQLSFSNHE